MDQTLDIDTVRAIEAACATARPRPRHGELLAKLAAAAPAYRFEHGVSRNGWFRCGGLITPTGERITEDMMAWAEAAWSMADEEGERVAAACRGDDEEADLRFDLGLPERGDAPVVTRIAGETHYFVARYGTSPEAFVQLEVEELRELTSHRLGECGVPDSIEDLVAAPRGPSEGRPVGPPTYRLGRVNDMARVMARMTLQLAGEPAGAIRFIADWSRSRANAQALCEHWLLPMSVWTDRYGVERIALKPMAVQANLQPPAPVAAGGAEFANALHAYDRQAGYPMAWYFDMAAGRGVSESVAHAVLAQWNEGYRYLPERDLACVADYCRRPYRA